MITLAIFGLIAAMVHLTFAIKAIADSYVDEKKIKSLLDDVRVAEGDFERISRRDIYVTLEIKEKIE